MKEWILLAVDDNQDNLYVIENLVNEHLPQCRVITASNAEEGFEIARTETIDAALVDVQMPGMSGIEMCRELKASESIADFPVILITAHRASGRRKAEGLLAGADDFLNKPIDNNEFIAKIKVMLRLKEMGDELRESNNRLQEQVAEKTRSLRESEERFRHVAESMADWIWEIDLEGNITYVSSKVEHVLGFKTDELVGKSIFSLMPMDRVHDELEVFQEHVAARKPIQDLESWVVSNDGRKICLLLNGRPLLDESGNLIGYRGVSRDFTENKRIDMQLRQAQKMEAIGTLAGGIAHDFNNILYALMGYTDLALDLIPENTEAYRYLTESSKAAVRAKELVEQILTFSRQADVEYRSFQVEEVLKEVMNLLRKTIPSTIEIRLFTNASPAAIWGNPVQVHQVIMNLCTNAYHAMRERGDLLEVRLDRFDIDDDSVELAELLEMGKYLRLRVEDNGCGMDEATLERIFDPYFSTKTSDEGTGLGLATTLSIVKKHNGAITVNSLPGEGTAFDVYLPVFEKESKAVASREPEAHDLKGNNERILFVDDDPFIANLNRIRLEGAGYSVVTFTSSLEALDAFQADPFGFDAVITDQTMPQMAGVELAGKMSAIKPGLPVILCTGFSETLNGEDAKAAGVKKIMMKPVAAADLMRALQQIMMTSTQS